MGRLPENRSTNVGNTMRSMFIKQSISSNMITFCRMLLDNCATSWVLAALTSWSRKALALSQFWVCKSATSKLRSSHSRCAINDLPTPLLPMTNATECHPSRRSLTGRSSQAAVSLHAKGWLKIGMAIDCLIYSCAAALSPAPAPPQKSIMVAR